MPISTLRQAEQALLAYVPLVATYGKDGMTLDRLWPLLKLVGNPHQRLKVVHIAGTSGKTSTAYYAAVLLGATNKKVGLTVSPHVDTVAERVQIAGVPLAEAAFCAYLDKFLSLIAAAPEVPSYFEVMIVFALWVFWQEAVDYAVVETGMGGLLDGSNVVTRPDKVCVLTDIGLDHQHVLGNTLPLIAAQKAGIMHAGNVAFSYQQPASIMKQFHSRANAVGASLHIMQQATLQASVPVGLINLPLYQQHNWLLAYSAIKYICQRDGLTPPNQLALQATIQTIVPGRMQVVMVGTKNVIMDGAHNQQKMQAFVASFAQRHPVLKVPVLLALKNGKDYDLVLQALLPIASNIIFTTFNTSQDLPVVSANPNLLAKYCESIQFTHYTVEPHQHSALKELLASTSKTVVITGSFYLLSQLRANWSDTAE